MLKNSSLTFRKADGKIKKGSENILQKISKV